MDWVLTDQIILDETSGVEACCYFSPIDIRPYGLAWLQIDQNERTRIKYVVLNRARHPDFRKLFVNGMSWLEER